jgi:MFS family permease
MVSATQLKEGSREDRLWEAALAQLTSEGVVAPEQAEVVVQRHQQIEQDEKAHNRRTAVIELVGYLGAALTIGGVAAISSQVWGNFSDFVQVLLIGALAVLVLVAASLLAGFTPGGVGQLATPEQAARRRLVGVLGILGAGLTTATLVLALDASMAGTEAQHWFWMGPLAGLAIAAICSRFAPGVVPTLGVGGFLGGTVLTVLAAPGWLEIPWVVPAAIMVVAAFAALVLTRWLKPVVLVEAIAIVAWLQAAVPLLVPEPGWDLSDAEATTMLWIGRVGLLALIAIGALKFTRGGTWPWAIGVAVGSALFVGLTFADALGGAIAMTIAGIVLIVVALLMLRTHRSKGA